MFIRKKKFLEMEKEIEKLKAEKSDLKRLNEHNKISIQKLLEENDDFKNEVKILEQKMRNLEFYRGAFKKIYTLEGEEIPKMTKRYALKCFERLDGLELFNPVLYRDGEVYTQTIDQYAEELNGMFSQAVIDPIPDAYSERARNIERFLKEIFENQKKNPTKPKTVERKLLQKIEE